MKRIFLFFMNIIGYLYYPIALLFVKYKSFHDLLYSQAVKYGFRKPIPSFVSFSRPIYFKNTRYIKLGNKVRISENSTITAWDRIKEPNLVIGDCVRIGAFAHITCANEIIIEDGTLIGKYVTITDNSHGRNSESELKVSPSNRGLYSKGEVHIGKNVWLGDKVTVLPGVHIGDSTIIGSNSVVTKDIPCRCIAGGIPAKVIKKIND